jgi:hypothetical protein
MSHPDRGALRASHGILRVLVVLNALYGIAIVLGLVASFVFAQTFFTALGVPDAALSASVLTAMRMVMVLGAACAPITHFALTRIIDIVGTVRAGDPFVMANARRLRAIAWSALALAGMSVVIAMVASAATEALPRLRIEMSFSFTPWLAVLLLFVLAQVFEQGARMREELAGTV